MGTVPRVETRSSRHEVEAGWFAFSRSTKFGGATAQAVRGAAGA